MRTAAGTLVLTAAIITGCAGSGDTTDTSGPSIFNTSPVYTLTNLHPDPARNRLYAVNYQQAGFIPRCTEVEVIDHDRNSMEFRVKETGEQYHYNYHKAAVDPLATHLQLFFGLECDPDAVTALSQVDQSGIEEGKVRPGMSKQGVIYAIGYPPKHVNPSTDMDEWTYWKSRFDRFIVHFDDSGKVENVQD